jgi:outer membrane protein insertion porin family
MALCSSVAEAAIVKSITVNGNKRIERSTILAYIGFNKGSNIKKSDIDAALKHLYRTGLFSDININDSDSKIVIDVVENPVVNDIIFEGNKRIGKEELTPEISLQSRTVYTRAKVQQDIKRITDLYQKNGRFAVNIVPKLVQLDQNRVDVIFEIDEGAKSTVRKIIFSGNDSFPDDKLKKEIKTREYRWYSFFSSDDTYDPNRLEYDKELLRKFYVKRGYADFKITSSIAEITQNKKEFIINIALDEGQKYYFGEISVDNQLTDINNENLIPVLKTVSGELFNAELIEASIDKINNYLNENGYAFIKIEPILEKDQPKSLANLTYKIQEGPKVYIERININGNVRTLDKVVRREFRLAEGDPYNASKLRRSQQRIRNLGFFDKVELQPEQGGSNDKAIINLNVQERSTGEVNFGAGFSTTDGALANASIRERNLLGKGQDLRFSIQRSTKGLEADISFTEPYFMGKNLALGFDLFNITRDRESESSYDSDSTGGVLRASYALTENLKHTVKYSIRNDKITDVESDASRFIKDQAGENLTSLIGHSLTYDTRDSRFEPRTGYSVKFNQDFAGIIGDSDFVRHELRADYYQPVYFDNVIMRLAGKSGSILGLGSDVRINERFFVGGSDIRGFKNAGIGPRDSISRDALGGNIYYTATTELRFPLGLPKELGFSGSVFLDAGSLSDADDSGSEVLDDRSVRMAAGVGVSWSSPLGPIRIDIANPILKESYDRTQQFRFNFGTRF